MKFWSCLITLVGCILLVAFVEAQNRGPKPVTGSWEQKLTYAQLWEADIAQPESARFHAWTLRYFAQIGSDGKKKAKLVAEGRQLARQRRAAFAKLIKSDPAQALASTVPAAVRKKLPHEVLLELETRVSGIGDFLPMTVDRAPGGPAIEPMQRFARLNNQTYRAYVYGRRTWEMTKSGIPLHGVAVDGVLALSETSLRELEPEEAAETKQGVVNLANRGAVKAAPVLAEMGGTIYRFVSRQHLLESEAKLETAEAGIGPEPREPATRILELGANAFAPRTAAEPNSWTIGNKHWLIIRVDFSDLPGDPTAPGGYGPYTAEETQTRADTLISPFYASTSYGLTSLTNTATTQLYRMPHTAEYYATTDSGIVQCIMDAETAASANYTIGNYERIALLTSYLGNIPGSQITYGGGSTIGGPDLHLNGFFDFRVPAHELGHTYGLNHAGLWHVSDSNPVSPNGTHEEYGDDFDVMGNGYYPRDEFTPWHKNILGWLEEEKIQTVTQDGLYRVYRFDTPTPAAGVLALKIPRDLTRDYWVGCRRSYEGLNPSIQHGAYITWGYHSADPGQSDLLDMTTPGNSPPGCDPEVDFYCTDAALAVGSMFTDTDADLSIEIVDEGGSGASQYIDVRVTFRSKSVTNNPLVTDPGWVRQAEWAFGTPTGQGGAMFGYPDPTSGATGANVFGVNLNGDVTETFDVRYYLTTGSFNFAGLRHSQLRFARWLNSDYYLCSWVGIEASLDGSTWTTVWSNDQMGEITDSAWTKVAYDISAIADNKPNVLFRWGYSVLCGDHPHSGWNIDDIELIAAPLPVLSNSLDSDPGWTRQGQWAFGIPTGGGGASFGHPDPTSGLTGTKVFGVNLAGDYSLGSGGPFYLTAGPFNFAGRRAADLRFARWLNTDSQPNASATIDVSTDGITWTPVWNNGTNEIADAQWSYVDYNISSIADFQPRVYVRWGYTVSGGARSFSGWNIDDVALFAALPKILPIKAVSRKTQGSGTYDINLPLSGAAGIECRAAGAGGTHQIVVTFAAPVTSAGATVIKGTGNVSSIGGNNTDTLTVNLSGVSSDAQLVVVKLANVADGVATGDVGIQMGLLPGDTSGNGTVNSTDVNQTKSQSGQPTTAANFRQDVNNSGLINSTDVSTVKAKSGTALP